MVQLVSGNIVAHHVPAIIGKPQFTGIGVKGQTEQSSFIPRLADLVGQIDKGGKQYVAVLDDLDLAPLFDHEQAVITVRR